MKWLRLAFQNALRNRRRSVTTALIAALGTASLLVAGGFGLYTYDSLAERATRESGHLLVAHAQYFDREEELPLELGLPGYAALRRTLERDPRVRLTLPRLQFSGLLSNGEKSVIFLGTGVDPDAEGRAAGPFVDVTQGRYLRPAEAGAAEAEVLVARDLARSLHAKVGSTLTLLSTTSAGALNGIDVRVCGVFATGTPELDKRLLLTPLATAQELLVTDRVSTLSAVLRRTGDTGSVRAAFARAFPGHALRTWEDLAFYYKAVRGLYNRLFGILGAVIVGMVFFAVGNTIATAVTERTREIGTLAALGTLPEQIVRTFVLEATQVAFAGAVAGMLFAGALSLALLFVEIRMPPPPGMTVGYPIRVYVSPLLYALSTVAITAGAALSALLAARRGVRKPIVEALAHV